MARTAAFQESRFRRLEYTVILSIVGFAVAFAGISIWAGIGGVMKHLSDLDLVTVAALLALSLINYALRAWRWQIFSTAIELVVPWRRNVVYYLAGFAMTTTPGKAGEALRLWLIERCHGYGYHRLAPMFVGDRLSDMIAHTLIAMVGVGAFSHYAGVTALGGVLMAVLLFAFLRPVYLLRLANAGHVASGRKRPRLFGALRSAIRETSRLFKVRVFGFGLILAIIGWLAEVLAFWILLHALDADVTFQQAMFIFVFSMAMGALAMLPGGLGGTEAVMIALLVAIGLEIDRAVAATAVIRLTTLWFATGLGFIVLPGAMKLARRGLAAAG